MRGKPNNSVSSSADVPLDFELIKRSSNIVTMLISADCLGQNFVRVRSWQETGDRGVGRVRHALLEIHVTRSALILID